MSSTIALRPGWNLIAFDATPVPAEPAKLFEKLVANGDLLAVWGYTHGQGWVRFDGAQRAVETPPSPPDSPAKDPVKALDAIQAGQAYYLRMKDSIPSAGVPFQYQSRLVATPLVLHKGWNLVGFDAGQETAVDDLARDQQKNLSAVLRWSVRDRTWETWKTDPAFKGIEAHRGYWVKAEAEVQLEPRLQLMLDGDLRLPPAPGQPPGRFLDFNRNGKLDGATEQDAVQVGPDIATKDILVRNEGDGSLVFLLEPAGWWKASTSPLDDYPPVLAEALEKASSQGWEPAGQAVVPWLKIAPASGVCPFAKAGAVLVSRDHPVNLAVDRTGLPPGHYLARLRVHSTGGARTVFVVMTVPPMSGDYEGEAVVTSVNGRKNELGRHSLRICLSESPSGPLLGVLDAAGSLVFPVDVPLVGGYIDPATRRFVLSGSYTRPARDTSQAELQPVNPFARRLIRTVTFMGAEVTSGLLRGEYSETVQGPLPFPVVMHGTFDLHRKVSNSMPASSPEARLDVTPPTAVNASAPAAKDPEPQAEAAKPAAPDSGLRLPQPEKEVKGPFPLAGTVAGLFAGPQKAPLANASIVLTGSHVQLAVTSGAEGKFVFPEVYPGVYRLSASSLGFSLAGEGPHWAERTVEVLDDGMVNAADDREGDASQLFLRRRHAPEEPEAVLAVVPIGDSPAVVQLGNVYAAPVEEWQWKISSSSLAKSDHQFFETGDPWSWKAEKPGIYKIELTLKRRQIDKSQGHFSERQATVVVGPVGVVLKPDKTLQTIPASEVPLAFRRGVAGASTPGPAICDAKPEGAGNANYRIVGANVTAPMGGVCCGMATRVSPDAIILQVGPAAIIGKETR